VLPEALLITIFLSSRGCLSTSKTCLENSGNSSKNKIQLFAKDISQGKSWPHHQIILTAEAVW